MKQTILLSICILLISGTTPKEYKIKDDTAKKIFIAIRTVEDYLDKSNLPHQDVIKLENILIDADTTFQKDIRDTSKQK